MSVLTCTTDPKGNYLGKVDLDISQYTEGEFKIHKLQLRGMNDQLIDGAFIEVGLKGEAGKAQKSSRTSTASAPISDVVSNASTNENKIAQLKNDLDNLRREKIKMQTDNDSKLNNQ